MAKLVTETVTTDRLGEDGPNRNDVAATLNDMAAFLNGLTDDHINLLTEGQRAAASKYFSSAAHRFSVGVTA